MSFFIILIPLLLWTSVFPSSLVVIILNKFNIENNIVRWGTMGVVAVALAIFVSWPLAKRCEQDREDNIQRRETVDKEVIKSCVQDYLIENDLSMDDDRLDEITEHIYNNKLYVDDDAVGFFVKESFLEGIKIAIQPHE